MLAAPAWAQPCDASGESPLAGLRMVVESARTLDADEPSGVAVLPDGRIVIVDDERGLYDADAGRIELKKRKRLDGLEGVTVSEDGKTLYAVSEDDAKVHAIAAKRDGSFGSPRSLGELPDFDGPRNKGWEGIAWLPSRFNPERRDRLVAVHEGKPRRVGLFDPTDLGEGELLRLPPDLKDDLADLSDVAIDPVTGNLFLLSDEASVLAEVKLVRKDGGGLALETIAVRKLPFKKGLRPEGLAFDGAGNLLVVTEADGKLRSLRPR